VKRRGAASLSEQRLHDRLRVDAVGAHEPPVDEHGREVLAPRVDLTEQCARLLARQVVGGRRSEGESFADRRADPRLEDADLPLDRQGARRSFGIAEQCDLDPARDVDAPASTASGGGDDDDASLAGHRHLTIGRTQLNR
jgi:hypothetical protein